MKNTIIAEIEKSQLKDNLPAINTGDTVKIHQRLQEETTKKEGGKKERVQVFEGVVLRHQGGGLNETLTVRKIVAGVGVEKTFPIHSKAIAKIELVKHGKVRRSKLYYLRDLIGSKVTRVKEDMQKNIEEANARAKVRKEAGRNKTAAVQPAVETAEPAKV